MSFKAVVIAPIKACRLRYIPLMAIYFAYGASSFSGIAESFFVKERLSLSAHELMMVSVWLSLPWTVKMIFGQFVDSIPLFGSVRRAYIFLGALFMLSGTLLLTGLAGKWDFVIHLGSANTIYILASLLFVIGLVMQDVVADAMSVEVVEREGRSQEDINHDLAMVQLLGRLSLTVALFLVAGIGGWLAQIFSYETIFMMSAFIPMIAIVASFCVKIHTVATKPVNWFVLLGGIFYAIFVLAMGVSDVPWHQEIVFVVSMAVVIVLLRSVTRGLSREHLKHITAAAIVIFFFRAIPSVGPALQWWQIDVLHFDKGFFGTLGQIGAGLAIVGMWVLAKYVTEKPIGLILIILTVISFILSLPVLAMYYGLHEWTLQMFGFGAHTIALVDTAMVSPFAQLSMIPMLTLIAIYAPRGNAATWFALMASLMNLALTFASLMSKWFNQIWVVTREIRNSASIITTPANYSQLGHLLWVVLILGLIVPIAAVLIFMRGDVFKRSSNI